MQREYLLYFPDMLSAKKAGFSSNDIAEYLLTKYNISLTPAAVRTLFSLYNKKSLFPKFAKKLVYFYPDNLDLDFKDYSNVIHGLFYTYKSFYKPDELIPESWLITEHNLTTKITNPVGRIYAKWLLQLFHIPNSQLLSDLNINDKERNLINQIPQNVDEIYTQMLTDLKLKYMDYLSIKMKGS